MSQEIPVIPLFLHIYLDLETHPHCVYGNISKLKKETYGTHQTRKSTETQSLF